MAQSLFSNVGLFLFRTPKPLAWLDLVSLEQAHVWVDTQAETWLCLAVDFQDDNVLYRSLLPLEDWDPPAHLQVKQNRHMAWCQPGYSYYAAWPDAETRLDEPTQRVGTDQAVLVDGHGNSYRVEVREARPKGQDADQTCTMM